jgi:hypothetical protein
MPMGQVLCLPHLHVGYHIANGFVGAQQRCLQGCLFS